MIVWLVEGDAAAMVSRPHTITFHVNVFVSVMSNLVVRVSKTEYDVDRPVDWSMSYVAVAYGRAAPAAPPVGVSVNVSSVPHEVPVRVYEKTSLRVYVCVVAATNLSLLEVGLDPGVIVQSLLTVIFIYFAAETRPAV